VPAGPDTGPESIEREVRYLLSDFDASPAALGIAVPGLVDAEGRVMVCDTLPRLEGWQGGETFADLGCMVRVLNDAEAALAEETHDLGPDATAVIVMAGTWIGTAIRAHGAPLRGGCGWAGEFGYAPVAVEDGRVARLDDLAGARPLPAAWAPTARGSASGPRRAIRKHSPSSGRPGKRWVSGWQRW
jgi:predicted NBD/HSP70 family sugar kinase